MAGSPKFRSSFIVDEAIRQIPRFTERISSCLKDRICCFQLDKSVNYKTAINNVMAEAAMNLHRT